MTVSVIITSHNYGQYLAGAVDSALTQTAPVDVLVIDDGSTDDSLDVLAAYGDRITVLAQDNAGVIATRNRGLAETRTEFVVFLDADNQLDPRFVEHALARYQQERDTSDVAFVYGDEMAFGDRTGLRQSGAWDLPRLAAYNYIDNTVLLHRERALAVGGYSPDMQGLGCEDWDLWLTLAHAGHRGLYEPRAVLRYRVHDEGITAAALRDLAPLQAMIARRHPWRDQVQRGTFADRLRRKAGAVRRKL